MSKLVFGGETLITATELDAKGYQDSSAVAGAIATAVDGLATDASVETAIASAVVGLATDASVASAIASATEGIATNASVASAIETAVAGLATDASVEAAIETAVAGLATNASVEAAIASATEGLVSDASLQEALADVSVDLTGYATDASVESAIASATAGFQTAADVSAAINGAGFLTEVSVGSFATPASDPSFAKKADFSFNDTAQSWGHTVNGNSVYVCAQADCWDTPYGDYTAVKFKAYYSPEEGPQSAYYIGYAGGEMGETFIPLVSFAAHSGGTADIAVDMGGWTSDFYRQKATVNTAEGVQIVWPELTAADYDSENSRLDASKNWAYIIFPYKYYTLYIEGEEAWGDAPNAPYFLQMGNGKVEAYFDFTPGQAAGNALDSRITEVVNAMDLDVDTTAIDASISALDASIVAINSAGYQTASDVSAAINNAVSDKVTTSELSNYYTKTEVDNKVSVLSDLETYLASI